MLLLKLFLLLLVAVSFPRFAQTFRKPAAKALNLILRYVSEPWQMSEKFIIRLCLGAQHSQEASDQ